MVFKVFIPNGIYEGLSSYEVYEGIVTQGRLSYSISL